MFEDYVALKNIKVNPDDFPTDEDYKNHVYSVENEAAAIRFALAQNGYEPVFTHLDEGIYHYELEQL
jgi:hypothetical protein